MHYLLNLGRFNSGLTPSHSAQYTTHNPLQDMLPHYHTTHTPLQDMLPHYHTRHTPLQDMLPHYHMTYKDIILPSVLTLNPLAWRIGRAANNASRWQMGFNSTFSGLT
jgi:hypothetical protein